tara:strand:+ start:1371 stop:1832 length:462 start_codon:yes stop_codon:yes gene_type:complete
MPQYMVSITMSGLIFLVSTMLPFETNDLPQEDEEDIDPFAELEIGTKPAYQGNNNALAAFEDDEDPLSALADENDNEIDEIVISFEDDDVPEIENSNTTKNNPSEITYKLLLETVWVDDILDPSEVQLLARKRGELGLSFERHLQLVRDIIGG